MDMDEGLATGVTLSPTLNVSRDGEIVQRWMEMVLGEKFSSDLPSALRSGELICDLVNKMYKALGMKSQISPVRGGQRVAEATAAATAPTPDSRPADDTAMGVNTDALTNVLEYLRIWRKDWSPMSEHGVFDDDEELDMDMEELDLESPDTVSLLQQTRWQRLVFEYEYQQQRKEERDRAGDSSASEGLGPLAHDIWRTEERIRALLLRDDRDFGNVPEELHGKLWMLASGAQMEMRKHKGQYERLLAMELESTESTRQIDVDLHRTVAEEDKGVWSEEKSRMMRRVLVAYSFFNPNLGYCQGLNYIVARSLLYLGEEEAFYLLIEMIRLVPDDYYTTMIGRGQVDALTLMKVSRKQDSVIRGRIEDFRAHHRLQLASGIVASSVETDDARSSTAGRRSSESRAEPKLRIFGNRKKQSIFRHPDKIAGRLSRSGSYKEAEGRRMKSDTNLLSERPSPNGSEAGGSVPSKGLARERRSKSSAFILARKHHSNGGTSIPNSRSVKDGDDDDGQMVGRSPLAWIQRFEEWHKDLKIQKEKKKAEKLRQKHSQRSESVFFSVRSGLSESIASNSRVRDAIESSPLPFRSQPKKTQTPAAQPFWLDQRRKSNGHQHASAASAASITMAGELALSRSFSDPFQSPMGNGGQRQRQNTTERARHEEMNKQILIRSQLTGTQDNAFTRDKMQSSDYEKARELPRDGSGRNSRGLSEQSTLSRSTISYANAGSFALEHHEDANGRPSSEEKAGKHAPSEQKRTTLYPESSPAHDLLYSPVHYRSCSEDFPAEEQTAYTPPQIRRNVSVPVAEAYVGSQQKRLRHPKRMKSDSTQAIRDRANVVSYMNRKASDTSSMTGSIPRSPRERMDMARMSGSSSDSSRFGEHPLNSNRSGKAMPYRKGSFSFFDKLSSDLESCVDGLNSAYPDDDLEFKVDTNGDGSMSPISMPRVSTVDEQRVKSRPGVVSISTLS
ncbi:hypothetical protein BBJ28_00013296 [Nothophytophthora sp. Chile5]|nr:hypothetical protein BBJ28_00013296 [Nothophytophthora sp. Chile5]